MKKCCIISIAFLLILITSAASASTIVVPEDYPDIKSAVENASSGDKIIVKSGIYSGPMNSTITIDKPLTIVCEGNVTVDLSGRGYGFKITDVEGVIVTGFRFLNGYRGILFDGNVEDVLISNCIFEKNDRSIEFGEACFRNITIDGCLINLSYRGSYGILKSGKSTMDSLTIKDTMVIKPGCEGIILLDDDGNNKYLRNVVMDNVTVVGSKGYHGIKITMYDENSSNVRIVNSNFSENKVTGIYLESVRGEVVIANNYVRGNRDHGIYVRGLGDVDLKFYGNHVGFNGKGVRLENVRGRDVVFDRLEYNGYYSLYIRGSFENVTIRNLVADSEFKAVNNVVWFGEGTYRNVLIEDCYINMNYTGSYGIFKTSGSVMDGLVLRNVTVIRPSNEGIILLDDDGNNRYLRDVTIEHVRIVGSKGYHGVKITMNDENSSNVSISNSEFVENKGKGILIERARGKIILINNNVSFNGDYGIWVQGSNRPELVIRGNTVYGNGGGVWLGDIRGSNIVLCDIKNNGRYSVYLRGEFENVTICNLTADSNVKPVSTAIYFGYGEYRNVSIENCYINLGYSTSYGIFKTSGSIMDGLVIRNTTVMRPNNEGIILLDDDGNNRYLRDVIMKNFTVIGSKSYHGIKITMYDENSANLTFSNCTFASNAQHGIYVERARGSVSIFKCNVTDNGKWGIYVYGLNGQELNVDLCTLRNKNGIYIYGFKRVNVNRSLIESELYGMEIVNSQNVVIFGCEFRNGDRALYIHGGSGVRINYCNIINSTYAVYNYQPNIVNATYNYWGFCYENRTKMVEELESIIYDDSDNSGCGEVIFEPWLCSPVNVTAPVIPSKKPDIVIENVTLQVDPMFGGIAKAEVIIKNTGGDCYDYFYVALICNDDVKSSYKVYNLLENESLTLELSYRIDEIGNISFKVVADCYGNVDELNESNNISPEFNFTVKPPDLVVNFANVTLRGDRAVISANVTNIGYDFNGVVRSKFLIFNESFERVLYSSLSGLWREGESRDFVVNWYNPVGGHLNLKIAVDYENSIPESNESNNVLETEFVLNLPDLIAKNITVIPADSNSKSEVIVEVENTGADVTTGFGILVKDEERQAATLWVDDGIKAGEKKTYRIYARLNPGFRNVSAFVDYSGDVTESNESNNVVKTCVYIRSPDLVVKSVEIDKDRLSSGETVNITAEIENIGDSTSKSCYVAFIYRSTVIRTLKIPDLSAGEVISVSTSWNVQGGSYAIKVVVDYYNHNFESNEDNNCASVNISVPMPDLWIKSIEWLMGSAGNYSGFTVNITALNGTKMRFYVGIKIDGTLRILRCIDGIGDCETKTIVMRDVWISEYGRHSIEAIVDVSNSVAELNENNNSMRITIDVPDTRPPIVEYISPENNSVVSNATVFVKLADEDSGVNLNDSYINMSNATGSSVVIGDTLAFIPQIVTDGEKVVRVHAVDREGNWKDYEFRIIVDTKRPVISIENVSEGCVYDRPVHPQISVFDDNLEEYRVTLNGHPYSFEPIERDGSYTLEIFAEDKAGNIATKSINFSIDLAPNPPCNLRVFRVGNYTKITWDPSPDSDVAGYNVYADDVRLNDEIIRTTSYVTNASFEILSVTAVDYCGHESESVYVEPLNIELLCYGTNDTLTVGFADVAKFRLSSLRDMDVNAGIKLLDSTGNVIHDIPVGLISLRAGVDEIVNVTFITPENIDRLEFVARYGDSKVVSQFPVKSRVCDAIKLEVPERIHRGFPETVYVVFRNFGSADMVIDLSKSSISLNGRQGEFEQESIVVRPEEVVRIPADVIGDSGKIHASIRAFAGDFESEFSAETNVTAVELPSVEVMHETLKKGTSVMFYLKFTNLGSGEITVKSYGVEIVNYDGDVIAQVVKNDRIVLNGHESIDKPLIVCIPLNSPDHVIVNSFFKVYSVGVTEYFNTTQTETTVTPAYDGNATLPKTLFRRGEEVTFYGYAFSTSNGSILPNTTLKISICSKGFVRNYFVKTDERGYYSFKFRPSQLEAGRFIISVTHPDVLAVERDAEFEIIGLYVKPSRINLNVLPNFSVEIPVSVRNLGDSALTDVHFECDSGYAIIPDEIFSLKPKERRDFKITFRGNNSQNSTFQIRVVSNEMTEFINVSITVHEPKPHVYPVPLKIETGAKPHEVVTREFNLTNVGFAPMRNVTYQSDIEWITFVTSPSVVPEQSSVPVVISIKPPSCGVYTGRITVRSENHEEIGIPIRIIVTPNETGSLKFVVRDYAGNPVENSTLTIANPTFHLTTHTDCNGVAVMKDVPIGVYKYYVHKPNYEPAYGTVKVEKDVEGIVNVTLLYTFLKVEWRVLPIKIADKYVIVHNITYDSRAPVPYIEIEEKNLVLYVNYSYLRERGYVEYRDQIEIRNKNYYISVFNVTPRITGKSDLVEVIFGVEEIPELKPNQSVTIPYIIRIYHHKSPEIDPCKEITITFTFSGEQYCITEGGKIKKYYVPSETITITIKPVCLEAFKAIANFALSHISKGVKVLEDVISLHSTISTIITIAKQCVSGYYGGCVKDKTSCLLEAAKFAISKLPVVGELYSIVNNLADIGDKLYKCLLKNSCPQPKCERPETRNLPPECEVTYHPSSPVYYYIGAGIAEGSVAPILPSVEDCKEPVMTSRSLGKTCCICSKARTSQASEVICVRVKLEIRQTLTMERQAFDAMLKLTNLADYTLKNVSIRVVASDEEGRDSTDMFFISVRSTYGIDGTENSELYPNKTAEIHWLIIPKVGAGGEFGKRYELRAIINGTVEGSDYSFVTWPDEIFVEPMPLLELDYVLPRNVYGDDPFTPEKEEPIPFIFGVRVKNVGYGTARNVVIESAQPKIVERSLGVYIDFYIIDTIVNGFKVKNSLKVDFGDIKPGKSSTAAWRMIAEMKGSFVEYRAKFTHEDALGGRETSLLRDVRTHWLKKAFMNTVNDDGMIDFLIDDDEDGIPEKIIDSSGFDFDVRCLNATVNTDRRITFDETVGREWIYLNVSAPGGKFEVLRSDGRKPVDYWIEDCRLNVLDCGPVSHYVIREIVNMKPFALFTVNPSPAVVNGTVTFNASFSYDPDGYILNYTWNFGDGNLTVTDEPVITHVYTSAATYNVTLTVTDNFGSSNSITDTLTVVEFVKGDFNYNGVVDIGDACYVAFMIVGKIPVDLNADFNENGRVDIGDLVKIVYYIIGRIEEL